MGLFLGLLYSKALHLPIFRVKPGQSVKGWPGFYSVRL
jgi:hypothetical protein